MSHTFSFTHTFMLNKGLIEQSLGRWLLSAQHRYLSDGHPGFCMKKWNRKHCVKPCHCCWQSPYNSSRLWCCWKFHKYSLCLSQSLCILLFQRYCYKNTLVSILKCFCPFNYFFFCFFLFDMTVECWLINGILLWNGSVNKPYALTLSVGIVGSDNFLLLA